MNSDHLTSDCVVCVSAVGASALPGEWGRAALWAEVYLARLKQGNAVKQIDYMAHHPAVEAADAAVKAFDERFLRPAEEEVFVDGHCIHCGQAWSGTL